MKIDKNKTYTVTQIANIAGVSKASVSRWLSDRGVNPDHVKGKAKYFKSTCLQQYLEAHKAPQNKSSDLPTTTELLQEQISLLKEENKRLIERIEKQDLQIKEKDQQISNWTNQSAIISKLANDSHNMNKKLLETQEEKIEKSDEKSNSISEVSDHSKESTGETHLNWFQRHFGKR